MFVWIVRFDSAADVMERTARRRDIIYDDDGLIVCEIYACRTKGFRQIFSSFPSGELGLLASVLDPASE